MKRVQVLLSGYNGEKYIQKQLDTIFAQKGVEVSCLVRDDGSSDGTLQVLRAYQEQEPRLQWVQGENLGWRKSFGYMPADTAAQVRQVRDYKETLWNRLRLFADRGFVRTTREGTLMLKLCVLLGRY